MNLLEVIEPKCRVLTEEVDEKTNERVLRVAVKWQHSDIINGNRRRYPKAILQREIDRLTPLIKEGKVSGASFHPEKMGELDDISHLWESIKMEQDGSCTGVVKVIPTARGKNAQAIIKAGGHIGMSSRGTGTITQKEEVVDGKRVKVDEINSDYVLLSPGDFVLSPSVPGAGTVRLMESKLDEREGTVTLADLERFGLVEDGQAKIEEDILKQRFQFACTAGFKGSFGDYKKLMEKGK